MLLKMRELMELSGESKSTILYYVKEGLLPEPSKPKPNVHLYDENAVKILKFIKYLQHNFSYSISQIKSIFQENSFDFDGSFDAMIHSLELISGGKDNKWYSKEAFLALMKIEEEVLLSYEKKGYLKEKPKGFSSKEVEIVEILERAKTFGLDFKLIDSYVAFAKKLGEEENEVGSLLLEDNGSKHDKRYALLFDIILTLKPYIFNMHTVKAHQHNISKDKK